MQNIYELLCGCAGGENVRRQEPMKFTHDVPDRRSGRSVCDAGRHTGGGGQHPDL